MSELEIARQQERSERRLIFNLNGQIHNLRAVLGSGRLEHDERIRSMRRVFG